MAYEEVNFVRGRIIQKRKHHNGIGYAIKPLPSTTDDNDKSENSGSITLRAVGGSEKNQENQQNHEAAETPKRIPPVLVLVPKNHPCVAWCFVGAVVHVDLKPVAENDHSVQEEKKDNYFQEKSFESSDNGSKGKANSEDAATSRGHRRNLRDGDKVELIQCSPDPNAIVACLKMLVNGDLTLSSFPISVVKDLSQIKTRLAASPKDEDRRKWILDISRELQVIGPSPESHYQCHHPEARKYGTSKHARKPRIKRRYWYVLNEMEKVIPVFEPLQTGSLTTTENALSRGLNIQALQKHLETQAIPAEEVRSSVSAEDAAAATGEEVSMVWNVPNVHAQSNNHPISRVDYLKQKKFPQVRWLLQKLQYVLQRTSVPTQDENEGHGIRTAINELETIRVLDVGGGRGDLAVAMAQAFPNIHVTVVDLNGSSLQAGQAFAEQMMGKEQADNRTAFVCADFASFARDIVEQMGKGRKSFDVVIAWHACGDLSDFALEFAMETNSSFIICPCCFTKRYICEFTPKWIVDYTSGNRFMIDTNICQEVSNKGDVSRASGPCTESLEQDICTVQRIAEINENSEVSRRAMLLINTMRLISFKRRDNTLLKNVRGDDDKIENASITVQGLTLTLEEYDLKHSSKNQVLVGIQK